MIRGIKFVNVPVTNQDAAVKFYTEKLGFRVLTDQPFNDKQRWIELGIPGGESKLVLFTADGDAARIGSHQPVTFWSDDVHATSQVLKSKGLLPWIQRQSTGARRQSSKIRTGTSSCSHRNKVDAIT